MQRNYRNAYNELKRAGVPVYTREDIKGFGISGEEANSYLWVNYWEGYKLWGSDTNPELDQMLRKHGLFAECKNPGEWGVYEL
jgi:hypothetical protein